LKRDEVEYWKSLYEVQRGVCSTLNLEKILDLITSTAVEKMGVKASSIRLLDRDKDRLELVAANGLSEKYLKKGPVEVEKSQIDKECLEGKNVIVEDVSKNGRLLQYPDEAVKEKIASMLCTPLAIRGKTIGVMRVYSDKPHRFNSDEIEFLSALSGLGAMAIENARLYRLALENLQDLTKELWEKSEIWGKTKKI